VRLRCGAHTHTNTRASHADTGTRSNRQEGGRECQGGERAGPGGTRRPFTNLARANVLTVGCCAYAPAPHHRPVYEAPLPGDYKSRQVPCSAWCAKRAPPPERRVGGPLPNPTLRRTHHRIGCGVCCRGERAARRLSLELPHARRTRGGFSASLTRCKGGGRCRGWSNSFRDRAIAAPPWHRDRTPGFPTFARTRAGSKRETMERPPSDPFVTARAAGGQPRPSPLDRLARLSEAVQRPHSPCDETACNTSNLNATLVAGTVPMEVGRTPHLCRRVPGTATPHTATLHGDLCANSSLTCPASWAPPRASLDSPRSADAYSSSSASPDCRHVEAHRQKNNLPRALR
jgi:hypothetical protein